MPDVRTPRSRAPRRAALHRGFLLAAGLGLAPVALAQGTDPAAGYPAQPIRFVVPAAAGGGTDVIIRIVGKYLSEAWNASVIVDNRAGAGGVLGAQYVTTQTPDG
ncbi:MAG: tripartite tricarboxylate transporter substrate-binding protein [Pseudomonadota bacterium]